MAFANPRLPLHVLFVFIDGVGLGPESTAANPFSRLSLPAFNTLAGGQPWTAPLASQHNARHVVRPIDACLGVDGLPQSGTGQATLFTGVNCAEAAGRHFGPYPHSTSKPILASQNIFSGVQQLNPTLEEPAAFANAYPPPFFAHATRRNRWTVTTLSCIEAGIPIRKTDALQAGQALTAEIRNTAWRERLGIDVPAISEEEAARRLVRLAESHVFTLFEYYLTDKAGHSQSMDQATDILLILNAFFEGLIAHLNPENTLLVITSDHGNLEDLSTKSHTFNPVPLIAFGRGASHFNSATSLMDVTPTILETLQSENRT
ncbi:MAG: peptidase [Bacteroidota bacterium]